MMGMRKRKKYPILTYKLTKISRSCLLVIFLLHSPTHTRDTDFVILRVIVIEMFIIPPLKQESVHCCLV